MARKAVLFLSLFLSYFATAHADAVKDALNQKYKKQLLALRSPLTGREQRFDSSGQPANAPSTGQWLTYGGIYVEKLDVSQDTLRLEGHRVSYAKDKKGKWIPLGKPVKVEIHLDQPLASADEARAVLGRVFFLGTDALEHATPEYRRVYEGGLDQSVYHVGKDDTKPPKATFTPEPEFSEEARRAKYQGVVVLSIVVDQAGNVSRIRLMRTLGLGLDDKAMEGVKRWRFDPATRNGQPVAVEMNIEVSFNLY